MALKQLTEEAFELYSNLKKAHQTNRFNCCPDRLLQLIKMAQKRYERRLRKWWINQPIKDCHL